MRGDPFQCWLDRVQLRHDLFTLLYNSKGIGNLQVSGRPALLSTVVDLNYKARTRGTL